MLSKKISHKGWCQTIYGISGFSLNFAEKSLITNLDVLLIYGRDPREWGWIKE